MIQVAVYTIVQPCESLRESISRPACSDKPFVVPELTFDVELHNSTARRLRSSVISGQIRRQHPIMKRRRLRSLAWDPSHSSIVVDSMQESQSASVIETAGVRDML